MKYCDYGCNTVATVTFKNGRMCCSSTPNQCAGKRLRDSERKRGKPPCRAAIEAACRSRVGKPAWNKGKTKDTDDRVLQRSLLVQKKYLTGELVRPVFKHTDETKQRLSEVAKHRKLGGYVKGSGRGRKGWYKGIFCDSSWELAYVIWCFDHQKNIVRSSQQFQYKWNGCIRKYLPDFEVDGELVEVKGWHTEQFEAKLQQCPVKICVLYKEHMKPILHYVISTYGKNYIELYESGE